MSRCCRSVKVEPSVTTYCTVCTLVASRLGLNTSESTPSATVNQTLEVLSRAVPTQSLRATSRYDWAPGPPGAEPEGWAAGAAIAAPAGTPARTATSTPNNSAHCRRDMWPLLYPPRHALKPGSSVAAGRSQAEAVVESVQFLTVNVSGLQALEPSGVHCCNEVAV